MSSNLITRSSFLPRVAPSGGRARASRVCLRTVAVRQALALTRSHALPLATGRRDGRVLGVRSGHPPRARSGSVRHERNFDVFYLGGVKVGRGAIARSEPPVPPADLHPPFPSPRSSPDRHPRRRAAQRRPRGHVGRGDGEGEAEGKPEAPGRLPACSALFARPGATSPRGSCRSAMRAGSAWSGPSSSSPGSAPQVAGRGATISMQVRSSMQRDRSASWSPRLSWNGVASGPVSFLSERSPQVHAFSSMNVQSRAATGGRGIARAGSGEGRMCRLRDREGANTAAPDLRR